MSAKNGKRSRHGSGPRVRIIETGERIEGAPLLSLRRHERLDSQALDRAIEDAGYHEWVRLVYQGDHVNPFRAVTSSEDGQPVPDHSLETLDQADAINADLELSTHVHVRVLSRGVRAKMYLTLTPSEPC